MKNISSTSHVHHFWILLGEFHGSGRSKWLQGVRFGQNHRASWWAPEKRSDTARLLVGANLRTFWSTIFLEVVKSKFDRKWIVILKFIKLIDYKYIGSNCKKSRL